MIGILLITHNNLGEILLQNAQQIVGAQPQIRAVSQRPGSSFQVLYNRVGREIAELDGGQGVLLMVDIFGGTPSNVAQGFVEERRHAMITGLNMAMLLKVLESDRQNLSIGELARVASVSAKNSIKIHAGPACELAEQPEAASDDESLGHIEEAQIDVEVMNALGLHASSSAKLVKVASRFKAEIFLANEEMEVNTKSIMGVLMLGAAKGTRLTLRAVGDDARMALKSIGELFKSKFGEE